MSRKPINLKRFLVPKLRRASLWWPPKSIARERAKVEVQIGTFKNGNPQFKTMYECQKCKELVDKKEGAMDHIAPVVDVDEILDWTNPLDIGNYVLSLFCNDSNYQHLCFFCHKAKTEEENEQRRANKKIKLDK